MKYQNRGKNLAYACNTSKKRQNIENHGSNYSNNNNHSTNQNNPSLLLQSIRSNNDTKSLEAIDFIQKIIKEYTLEQLAFSFNGGKDCMVLLYLIQIALHLLKKTDSQLPIIWFKRENEFNELESFVKRCLKLYKFPLFETKNDYKTGLEQYLNKSNPKCRGVFLGQRSSDPYCQSLNLCTHCTSGWPDIIRINPILDWSYSDIWAFLKKYNLNYCCLYDEGYTSLGDIKKTIPNPLLYDVENNNFKEAFQLKYGSAERFGRLLKSKNDSAITDVVKVVLNKAHAQCGGECNCDDDVDAYDVVDYDNIGKAVSVAFNDWKMKHITVDVECVANENEANEVLKWCKENYMYTFYTAIH